MYWDETVVFGLGTLGLVIAIMIGWVGFVRRDHRRKGKHRH
ncbi:cytochrome c oxidase subunit CcoM [Onishia taeanensis]